MVRILARLVLLRIVHVTPHALTVIPSVPGNRHGALAPLSEQERP